jgi:hypothetical protein
MELILLEFIFGVNEFDISEDLIVLIEVLATQSENINFVGFEEYLHSIGALSC